MVAPKGSGTQRAPQLPGRRGINSSFAVVPGRHRPRARSAAWRSASRIGSGYLFPTTFQHEVYSDLTGERGVLMGALAGIMEAQYDVLRANGHTPSEAFNETVEELTQSLIRLVDENGMDWMYSNCSATAQRGALDWKPRFKNADPAGVQGAVRVREDRQGDRDRACASTARPDYREKLEAELKVIRDSEMWQAGAAVRSLRPENWKKR